MNRMIKEKDPGNIIQVDNELLENISDLIENHASKSLESIFADLHPADIAEIINHLRTDDATYAFNLLDTDVASEVITELDENLREKILKFIDPKKIATIVDELDSDDATDIVSDLPEEVAEHVLENIDVDSSEDVKELLKYEEDTAGGLMNSDFVFVYEGAVIKDAIKEVRKHADDFEHIYHIYVLNNSNQLVGVVSLKSLLLHPFQTKISSIMEEDLIYATPDMDQEEVANLMEKYDLVAIPVVDQNKVMLGRITFDDIVDVIQEEAEEDISKFAGLSDEQEISDSVFRISRIRLPWLILALVIESINAILLNNSHDVLAIYASAMAFIPVVMAMGGSSGNQAAIVVVRGLATGDIWLGESLKTLSKEFLVALINGIICASIVFSIIFFLFNENIVIASIVSVTLLTIIVFATIIGAFIPLALKKMNIDPAIATGPFVSTFNDVFGISLYLLIITIFTALI